MTINVERGATSHIHVLPVTTALMKIIVFFNQIILIMVLNIIKNGTGNTLFTQ